MFAMVPAVVGNLSGAFQTGTGTTVGDLVTTITTATNGFVPELAVFIAVACVMGLVAVNIRKLLKAGR